MRFRNWKLGWRRWRGYRGTTAQVRLDQPATQVDQDQCPRGASHPRHYLSTGRGGRHRPDGTHHPRRDPPIASATAMRMTAIHAQAQRKRQDRSVRCAEKHQRRARTRRLRSDPPCSSSLRNRRHRLGRKMLVQRAKLGDLHVSQHATWGMSDEALYRTIASRC